VARAGNVGADGDDVERGECTGEVGEEGEELSSLHIRIRSSVPNRHSEEQTKTGKANLFATTWK
jgi:hypothetical protein